MKTWKQYLTEKDEYESPPSRNSFFQPQPPYTPHPEYPEIQWKVPDKQVKIYKGPGNSNKLYVPAKDLNLQLDGGEWWGKFEIVRWSGYSIVKTGEFENLPIAAYDKVNGISPVSTDTFTPDNMK